MLDFGEPRPVCLFLALAALAGPDLPIPALPALTPVALRLLNLPGEGLRLFAKRRQRLGPGGGPIAGLRLDGGPGVVLDDEEEQDHRTQAAGHDVEEGHLAPRLASSGPHGGGAQRLMRLSRNSSQ